jgi:hypothetical protein
MKNFRWNEFAQMFVATGNPSACQTTSGRVVAEGTVAEMVRAFALLTPVDREDHSIVLASQAWRGTSLIMDIYNRPDFPHGA